MSDKPVNHLSELEIIQKVLAGEIFLYGHLVDKYKDLAMTLAFNIVLNREDAEEIVQDAFVKSYTSLRAFKGASKFSTWFYRIVLNTSLNKRKLRKIRIEHISEELHGETMGDVAELAKFRNGEQKKYLKAAIKNLNENERICITLFYLNELSIEEIEELTGLSVSNIKILLHRGRKNLYRELHQLLHGEAQNLI